MRHFFEIKSQTIKGQLCNRKEFSLKVAGISILMSWPIGIIKTTLTHSAEAGTPWVKTNITSAPLWTYVNLLSHAIKENIRIRLKIESYSLCEATLKEHLKSSLGSLEYSVLNELQVLTMRFKMKLFGSGQAYPNVTVKHEGNLSCGHFYKLRDWDYDNGAERTLMELDGLLLSDMDIKNN